MLFSLKYVRVATGHPVYLRAAYATAERAAVCDLAETCARPCTRVRVYVRRGLVAARLPASALGCAARQDIEPSATQPGDHPRVQAALYSSPARISRTPAYPGPSPQPAIFRSPFSTRHEKRGPHPSRARKTFYEWAVVPTCDPRTPLLEFGLDTELLLHTHPREHFRR